MRRKIVEAVEDDDMLDMFHRISPQLCEEPPSKAAETVRILQLLMAECNEKKATTHQSLY